MEVKKKRAKKDKQPEFSRRDEFYYQMLSEAWKNGKGKAPPKLTSFVHQPVEKRVIKRVFLTVNPFGGKKKGLKILDAVLPIFSSHGVEVEVTKTKHAHHNTELALELDVNKYDAWCLIGGDGSINEVVTGLLSRQDGKKIPLGLIPGGTGNSFAVDLNEELKAKAYLSPEDSVKRILQGNIRFVDAAKVTFPAQNRTVYCFNIINWPAESMHDAESMRWLGPKRYEVATVKSAVAGNFGRRCVIEVDGQVLNEDRVMMIHVQNNQHTGFCIRASPFAKVDDGFFDLHIIRPIQSATSTRISFLKALTKMDDGSWVFKKCVESIRFRHLRITTADREPSVVNVDGEIKHIDGSLFTDPLVVDVIPNAFQIFH